MVEQTLVEQVVFEVLRYMEQTSEPSPAPLIVQSKSRPKQPADLSKYFEDSAALEWMKSKTPARIGIGRAGPRLRTETYIKFRADHATSRDAVMANIDPEFIKKLDLFEISTKCRDCEEHLRRPDLGRQLDEGTIRIIKEKCIKNPQVQVYVSDGLSSTAVKAGIPNFFPALKFGLERYGIQMGTPFYLRYGRVPAMEIISETLNSEVTCVLIGERPGLGTSDSMSAYIAYHATVGMTEARRTVVSNIHEGGFVAVEAGAYVADVIKKILEAKASGVDLKL